MSTFVVDASVAAKWVIEEDITDKALLLLGSDALQALAHWRAEAANVVGSKVFKGDLTAPDAQEHLLVLNRAPMIDTALSGLLQRALAISLAQSVTVYDALYLAFAEQRDF